jgi:hypothetical protein
MALVVQAVGALQQQHAEAVAQLNGSIALLEKSERQLLTAKAVHEGQLEKLRATVAQLQDRWGCKANNAWHGIRKQGRTCGEGWLGGGGAGLCLL